MTPPDIAAAVNHRLVGMLTGAGLLEDPGLVAAFTDVHRALFVPARARAFPDSAPLPAGPIDRDRDPDGWHAAVAADMSLGVQADDGAADPADENSRITATQTSPTALAQLLALLRP